MNIHNITKTCRPNIDFLIFRYPNFFF